LTPGGQPAGTTYSWAAPTMSDASAQGNPGAAVPEANALTILDNLVNTGSTPITATYFITATNGGCVAAAVPVVITVNPVPVGIPAAPTVCSDTAIGAPGILATTGTSVSAASFTIATNPNGLVQSAGTVSAGAGKGPNELVDDAWTNTTGANVNVIYTITPISSAGCAGTPFVVQVTIQPEPATVAPVAIAALCSDTPVGYTLAVANAATYNISTNSNGLIQSAGTVSAGTNKLAPELADDVWTNTNNAFASIDVVYTITPVSASGCLGNSFTVTVPVKPEPRGANHTATICSDTSIGYDLQVTNINALGNGMSSSFSWVAMANNPNVSGESLAPQAGSVITDIIVNPTGVDQVVNYQVTPTGTVSTCVGDPFVVAVTIKPAPIGVNQSVTTCSDVSPSYNLLNNIAILGNNVGSTFSWVAAPNGSVTGESTAPVVGPRITDILNNVTNVPQVVTYTVTPTGVNGCVGAAFTIAVTVEPEPVAVSTVAPTICSGTSVNYDLQNNVNTLGNGLPSNFQWSAAANPNVTGESTFGQLTNMITDLLINTSFVPQLVTYTVVPTGTNGCLGNVFTISVTVNPAAQLTAGPDLAVCSDDPDVVLQGLVTFAPNGASWTGPGVFAPNTADPVATYTHGANPPLETFVLQTLTFTANDPDGAGPCLAVSDQMTVRINGLPNVDFGVLPALYAENGPAFPLTGTEVNGDFRISVGSSFSGSQYINASGKDEIIFDPSLVLVNTFDTVRYEWIDPATGCLGSRERRVFITPVTVIDFGMEWDCGSLGIPGTGCIQIPQEITTGEFRFCSNAGLIRLIGSPAANTGDPTGTNFTAVITANATDLGSRIFSFNNEWYIDTNGLPSANYLLQYNYKDITTGLSSTPITYPVKVWAAPDAVITAPANNCNDSGVPMQSDSYIIGDPAQNPFGATVDQHLWAFGGGNAPGIGSGKNVNQIYPLAGVYTVTLTAITSNNCRDTDTFVVQVGAPPAVDFTWSDICTNDLTNFKDLTNPGISTIIQYTWNFGDGNTISGVPAGAAPEGGTFKDPLHNYATTGTWPATLTILTNDNCTNSIIKNVPILTGGATVAPTPLAGYLEQFGSGPGSWIPEGLVISPPLTPVVISPISWVLGVPAGNNINNTTAASPAGPTIITPRTAGDQAWWTGANVAGPGTSYFNLESSVVNGPCFDLRGLNRPMISLDYWADAEKNLDGAVVQYSLDGGLNWQLVGPLAGLPAGQRDQGINWYDPNAVIISNPGKQPAFGPYGWTDKSGGWKNARFNLDMIDTTSAARDQVRIRIAFSSNDQNAPGIDYDGFAFDNVFVGEKERNVLVEHFTNSTNPASTAGDAWIDTRYQEQIDNRGANGSDFSHVQYHINFPTADPINLENPVDPGARSLFMGVSQSPTTILDGIVDGVKFNGSYTNLDQNGVEADRRALVDPQFALQVDTLATSQPNRITVRLTMRSRFAHSDPLLAQVLLVENQTGTFKNVVRKQLFGPDGRTITQVFAPNDVRTEQVDDIVINVPITNPGNLSLLGYVQNKNTREIYQSVITAAPYKRGSVVVGLEDPKHATTLSGITIYPNPANGRLFLGVPSDQSMDGFTWKLIDQRGVTVRSGDFSDLVGDAREVPVSDLANGMYFIQLSGPGHSVVHRKVIVMNRN
ncbi:MAG: T9SS type A sorting domain-containing protein, partial [Cyclobacteriaceae bacterium]|nr:T9SS type A sorting domain-containing protein [Cyclobacteriaceae bacterium]